MFWVTVCRQALDDLNMPNTACLLSIVSAGLNFETTFCSFVSSATSEQRCMLLSCLYPGSELIFFLWLDVDISENLQVKLKEFPLFAAAPRASSGPSMVLAWGRWDSRTWLCPPTAVAVGETEKTEQHLPPVFQGSFPLTDTFLRAGKPAWTAVLSKWRQISSGSGQIMMAWVYPHAAPGN